MNLGGKVTWLTVRLRYFFLVAVVCGSGFLISMVCRTMEIKIFSSVPPIVSWGHQQHYTTDMDERFTIKTEGCTIPFLRSLDESVKKFVEYPIKMKPCRDPNIALLEYNVTRISIKKENIHYYNVNDIKHLSCCYRGFYRPRAIEDITSWNVDNRVKYYKCTNFTDSIEVNHEFIRVSCYFNETTQVYEQFYLTAPKKEFLKHGDNGEMPSNSSVYNVLILGIDAVSRLNLYRTMPKTISYIKDYGGVDLVGYNKVGDNTFPNVIPLLLGIKDTELKHTCIPHGSATFDNCPFVWEWFKQAGYYTALAEDSSTLGTFNYVKYGFTSTPTDYYIHTFMHEAEQYSGYNKDFNSFLCMNDKYFYKVLLDYLENLTNTLKNSKLFAFFWEVTMSHDYLNYPMVMDDDYLEFFKRLEASYYLSNTIIFLMSDHGIRWGDIRTTKQGRLEERLPFMFVMVPPSFRETYSEAFNNLKLNGRRLTTPFDIHATLMDLVNLDNIQNKIISVRSNESYAENRAISLFLPIPNNRTCKMAGIDDHWCTCHKGHVLPKESSESLEASIHLVRHLNSLMKEHPECARLTLAEVLEITEMEVGRPGESEVGWREFTVAVRASPGDGVFEATLRYDSRQWTLTGTVSRLNLYGDQSRCVHDYQLKLYCYCI